MNVQLNISHDPDELSADAAIMYYNDVKDGFIYNTSDLILKHENGNKFITEILNTFENINVIDLTRNKTNIYKKILHLTFRMYYTSDGKNDTINFYTKNDQTTLKIWEIFKKYDIINDNEINVFLTSFFLKRDTIQDNMKVLSISDFEDISDLYYPYMNTSLLFEQFFTGNENILLCVGEPGVGKSKLNSLALKFALQNIDKIPYNNKVLAVDKTEYIETALVKSVDVLINDEFWNILEEREFDFVLIDDLDYMLTKRSNEVQNHDDIKKNIFLNQFLSFTDGVEKSKTKFIITTNQIYDEIDAAVLRKGRLFDIIELRVLKNEEALNIWKYYELDEKIFHTLFKNNVLPADLGSEISKRRNKRIKNATKSYLFEENISKIKKIQTKKIGFK